jgi:hypothetical protein
LQTSPRCKLRKVVKFANLPTQRLYTENVGEMSRRV